MILDMLIKLFGRPKNDYASSTQYSFNCPKCALRNGGASDGKHNLEIKLGSTNRSFKSQNLWHCWKCEEGGDLFSLLKRWNRGNRKILDEYRKYLEDYGIFLREEVKPIRVTLPEEYIPFSEADLSNPRHREAHDYLTKVRKVDHETIVRYKLGFALAGRYASRIIIPSYDAEGELNYFSARSYDPAAPLKYDNARVDRSNIIFNEHTINWNLPVIMTEGPFEFLAYPHNNLVLLSKVLNDKVLTKLMKHRPPVIVCLNGDAFISKKDRLSEMSRYRESSYIKRTKASSTVGICRQLAEVGIPDIRYVDFSKIKENDLGEVSENSGKLHIFSLIKVHGKQYVPEDNFMII